MKFYFCENVKREGCSLGSGSEFRCRAISFVEKEGPVKNVMVNFFK